MLLQIIALLHIFLPLASAQWCYQQSTSMLYDASVLPGSMGPVPPWEISASKLVSTSGSTNYYKFLLNGYQGLLIIFSVSETGGVLSYTTMNNGNPCPLTCNRFSLPQPATSTPSSIFLLLTTSWLV